AIRETERKYGFFLRKIAYGILGDWGDAEECENDAYLQAWNRIPPNEPRTYLFSYLGRIVRHLAIDRCRMRDAEKRSAEFCELTKEMEECLPGGDSVEEAVQAEDLARTINRFLKKLPEEQCALFIRRYWFFDSVPEISESFGISESKVKVTLFRLRKSLGEYLKKEGYNV
ncbi:MAG: RNA polymerase sigma factor, partial [Lachnospiraceae bacterium]|nr:RNA polymerase sigma factor [Lachnospiraceae bacterium]